MMDDEKRGWNLEAAAFASDCKMAVFRMYARTLDLGTAANENPREVLCPVSTDISVVSEEDGDVNGPLVVVVSVLVVLSK